MLHTVLFIETKTLIFPQTFSHDNVWSLNTPSLFELCGPQQVPGH